MKETRKYHYFAFLKGKATPPITRSVPGMGMGLSTKNMRKIIKGRKRFIKQKLKLKSSGYQKLYTTVPFDLVVLRIHSKAIRDQCTGSFR